MVISSYFTVEGEHTKRNCNEGNFQIMLLLYTVK